MKIFIVTLLIFALLLCAVAFNFHYINSVCDMLEAKISALTLNSDEAASEELLTIWKKEKGYVSLSVSSVVTEDFEDRLLELHAMLKSGDSTSFYRARTLALGAISSIRRLERFALDNLL